MSWGLCLQQVIFSTDDSLSCQTAPYSSSWITIVIKVMKREDWNSRQIHQSVKWTGWHHSRWWLTVLVMEDKNKIKTQYNLWLEQPAVKTSEVQHSSEPVSLTLDSHWFSKCIPGSLTLWASFGEHTKVMGATVNQTNQFDQLSKASNNSQSIIANVFITKSLSIPTLGIIGEKSKQCTSWQSVTMWQAGSY